MNAEVAQVGMTLQADGPWKADADNGAVALFKNVLIVDPHDSFVRSALLSITALRVFQFASSGLCIL